MNYDKHYYEPQVADGWLPIVEEMLENLKDYPITILQIKEKFGQLRVYFKYADSISHDQATQISQIVEAASEKAGKTCEICGKPGKLKNDTYMRVGCDEH